MLPAYPWVTRPIDEPLTVEEVCAALWESEGDLRVAATRLKVGSLILRKFVERSSRAKAVIREADACLTDEAGAILREALRDSDARRQDWAIRYVLNSKNARGKGWGTTESALDAASQQGPHMSVTHVVQWANGDVIGPRAIEKPVIDLTPSPPSPLSDEGSER